MTFDDRVIEAVTEFIMDDKLGDPDHSTGENPSCTPFKRPRFMVNNFDPDYNDEDALDTKR